MRSSGQIYQQMPHQVVMTKGFFSIEHSTHGIKDPSEGDERDKLPRGVTNKERKEKYYGPAHNKVYSQAHSGYRSAAQGFIKYSEDHHHPLQDKYQPSLPATNYGQGYGGITACYGYIYKYMVEDMEYLLVARVVQHRVVERRDQEHHKEAHAKETNAEREQRIAARRVTVRRSKGQSQEHQYAHHAVGDGVAHLLAKCGDIYFCHCL